MLAAAITFPLLGIAGVIPGIPREAQILVAVALIGAPIGAHFLFPIPLTARSTTTGPDEASAISRFLPRAERYGLGGKAILYEMDGADGAVPSASSA